MSRSSDLLLERVQSATVGDYAIERELGRGGMAAVYLARDILLNRQVAIKVILPDLVEDAEIRERFLIEAQATAHLDHPGIVTLYSVRERDDLLFIVMKYIDGRTLEQVLKEEVSLDVAVVCAIIGQVAEALSFAHSEGVFHRDVKPSNILIDTRGRPFVTDFGIAKVNSARAITATGAMMGTPAFMSPEQCRGLPATSASDQYSLGVTAYEMLTRRRPFEGTIFELIFAHTDSLPTPPRELNPDISPEIEEAVLRMLAKNPAERWPSLSSVAHFFSESTGRGRNLTDVRGKIAALAREPMPLPAPKRRAAIAYDLSGADTEAATTPRPALVITPNEPSMEVGEVILLRLSDSSGSTLTGLRIEWRSEDATIASVDDDGNVTGREVGLAKISASAGGALGRAAVRVTAPRANAVVVTPQNPALDADDELQLAATVLDRRGNVLLNQPVVWTSNDVTVCVVSQRGRAIGVASGGATITALCGEVSGSAQVRVRPPAVSRVVLEPVEATIEIDESLKIAARILGPFDRVLAGRPVTWRSSVPTVLAVDADGTIVGVTSGSAAVIALCEGKEAFTSIVVKHPPVVAVRIQPAQLQLEVGRSLQLRGMGEDRRGRQIQDGGLLWHSDDDRVAIVDASGKVYAAGEGNAKVSATMGDVISSIEVTVMPRQAAQLRIEAHPPSLAVGEFVSLDAVVLDAEGASLSGRVITWSSSDSKVLGVSASGVVEAKKPGSARITAVCEGARSATTLSVPVAVVAPLVAAHAPAVAQQAARSAKRSNPAAPDASRAPQRAGSRRAIAVALGGIAVLAGAAWLIAREMRPALPLSPPAGGATTAPRIADSVVNTPNTNVAPAARGSEVKEPPTAPTSKAAQPRGGAAGAPTERPVVVAPASARGAAKTASPESSQGPLRRPIDTASVSRVGAAVKPPPATAEVAVRATPATVPAAPTGIVPPPSVVSPSAPTTAVGAETALLCRNQEAAQTALISALGDAPAAALNALYQPHDAADVRAKGTLLALFREGQGLNAVPRVLRSEVTSGGCDWIVVIDLSWTNAFGQPRHSAPQLRMQLRGAGGRATVSQLFGSSSK